MGDLGPDSDLTNLIKWSGAAESRAGAQRCQQHNSARTGGSPELKWLLGLPWGIADGAGCAFVAFKDLMFSKP